MILKRLSRYWFCALETGTVKISNSEAFISAVESFSSHGSGSAAGSASGGFVQVCSLKPIACAEQIFFAANRAFSAHKSGSAFSRRLGLELLLRIAGTKQISRIASVFKLKRGRNEICAIALAEAPTMARALLKRFLAHAKKEFGFKHGDSTEAMFRKNLRVNRSYLEKLYGISQRELSALSDLREPLCEAVIEKTALVALET